MLIAPEHIPTVDKVNAYLSTRAQGDLCAEVINCNSWPAEAFLMEDLTRFVLNERPANTTRAQTRLYLRAVSWFTYPAFTDLALIERIDALGNIGPSDRALLHEAFARHLQDEALEPAAQSIDRIYVEAWNALQKARRLQDVTWKRIGEPEPVPALQSAKDRVESLRPIRDAIYFKRHLPHWLAWAGAKKS